MIYFGMNALKQTMKDNEIFYCHKCESKLEW